jgi:Fe-S-cluster containining protein
MDRHFKCTACGKCCFGQLPLTLGDALRHIGRFPLAMVWTPVPQGAKTFVITARLGTSLRLKNRKQIAVQITPTAYVPPSFSCPELNDDGRCGIHAEKPLRCRSMPFYPFRDEHDQTEMLKPRKGWACDISGAAPVVYRDRKIIERADFDQERRELLEQVPTIRMYADYMLKYMPWVIDSLGAALQKPGSTVVTSLSSFFTGIRQSGTTALAAQQLPVLRNFEARTSGQPDLIDYQRHYSGWAKEMEYLARSGNP